LGGVLPLFGNFTKKSVFWDFFQLKYVRLRHPAYILNQRKKLYQKMSIFFDLWKIRGNLGEKVEWSGIHHKTFISIFFIF
jgi:hypothetical protein